MPTPLSDFEGNLCLIILKPCSSDLFFTRLSFAALSNNNSFLTEAYTRFFSSEGSGFDILSLLLITDSGKRRLDSLSNIKFDISFSKWFQ